MYANLSRFQKRREGHFVDMNQGLFSNRFRAQKDEGGGLRERGGQGAALGFGSFIFLTFYFNILWDF